MGQASGRFRVGGNVDPAFGDELKLITQLRFGFENFPNACFHGVEPVDLSGVEGSDPEFEQHFKTSYEGIDRRFGIIVEHPPGTVNHVGNRGAVRRERNLIWHSLG